jgi:hypothetical protein
MNVLQHLENSGQRPLTAALVLLLQTYRSDTQMYSVVPRTGG